MKNVDELIIDNVLNDDTVDLISEYQISRKPEVKIKNFNVLLIK